MKDTISLDNEMLSLLSPLGLKAHSTRIVASSQALFKEVPLEDICVAAGWFSLHILIRFYSLDLDAAPGSFLQEPAI